MQVEDLRKFCDDFTQFSLQLGIFLDFVAKLDGVRLAFDVSEYRRDLRHARADLSLESGHNVMRLLQRKMLLEFQMLLHVQKATQFLNADIVNIEVVSCGDRAYAIKDALLTCTMWERVHDDVS